MKQIHDYRCSKVVRFAANMPGLPDVCTCHLVPNQNCVEQLVAYVRVRIRREKVYEALFAATLGAIFGTLIAIGMKR